VPIVLPFLGDSIIALGGKSAEGCFRVPGGADEVLEMKARIDRGEYTWPPTPKFDDPHIAASLFKLWLRELRDPLIPEEYYDISVESAESPPKVIEIIHRLEPINLKVIRFVIGFLQVFAEEGVVRGTKMPVQSLAMVFAPNFLRCPSDSLSVALKNTKYEQLFLTQLITHLST